ncbi:serine/threonine protein phosphatase [Saccharothrix sp. NRRL B-16348]|uniref:PP2C family protein-serine/threonine phosphatase n=1 Tax=Saccharothrix sp. NRRL B-16348 TaxID=1415542 RepID=UPI0006AE822B|nr:PP2C family protein-serine/threonine phosphatase [Saccharothrix sp. NRRL B-16348]KOX27474.1 serine/threonine protein phosphatase [Saccharothrix sp. NRRL B-16348]
MAQGYRQGADTGLDLDAWRRVVDGFHEAVVVLDPEGVVRLANPLAAVLFPQARTGSVLPDDVADGTGRGRRHDLGGGWAALYRSVDDFLDDVARRMASLTLRADALRAVVELAPAEHAVVVLPGVRGRLEWWRRTAAGDVAVARTTRQVAGTAPGFTAVLERLVEHAELTELGDGPWGASGVAVAVPLTEGGALVCFGGTWHVELLKRYAARAAAAVEASTRFSDQQQTVEALRANLLPTPLPDVPGVRLASVYEPAHRRVLVGGDFYDVHPREDGSAAFVLGDVAGNGLEAAVHSSRVRQSLHTLLVVEQRPAQLLYLLNAALRAAGSRLFTTLVVGTMMPVQAGGLRLTLAAGGHPAPLVLRADGRVDEVAVHGGIVGVLPEVRFNQTTVTLAPGETLLLYSDGLTEARKHDDRQELFGDARLRAALADCAGLSADAVSDHLRRVVFDWLGSAEHDDLTLLVLQAAS